MITGNVKAVNKVMALVRAVQDEWSELLGKVAVEMIDVPDHAHYLRFLNLKLLN